MFARLVRLISVVLHGLRRWLTVLVVIAMLGMTVATHTVGFMAELTAWAISSVGGTVVSAVKSKPSVPTTNLPNRNRPVTTLDVNNRRLDSAVIDRLSRDNLDLRRQSGLDRHNIRQLSASQTVLRRQVTALTTHNSALRTLNTATAQLTTQKLARIQRRTRTVAGINFSSVVGESIPIVGIGVIVGATTFELAAACDTMHDLYDLQVTLDPDSAVPDDRKEVCGLKVSTRDEIWASIKSSPRAAWDGSVNAIGATADWASELEAPDFSCRWVGFRDWASGIH